MPRTPEVCPALVCPLSHFSNIASRVLRILLATPRYMQSGFGSLPSTPCRLPTAVRLPRYAFCFLLLLITYHSSLDAAMAQGTTATLSGTVTDQNDAVIPDVSIAVINIAQGFQRSATTNGEGTFVVPLLPPGSYTVKAEHQGFTPTEVRDVVLNVNDRVAMKIHMNVGTVSQTVQVAEGSSLINESPAVGTVVDRQFVANIPLNGRSFQSLIALTPGVVLTKTNIAEQGQFSVNGQRGSANYFMVDGVSANTGVIANFSLSQSAEGALPAFSAAGGTNSLVSVDAMQEFKIQTSTFAPEFGRTPGAQVSIVTRSGTNDFHGTLFDYIRNDVLDANDWFANKIGSPKPKDRQNDFGATFSGPIMLPRFGEGGHQPGYNGRNRTFFFFSYEGLRLRQPLFANSSVPSLSARQAAVPRIQPFLNAYPMPNGAVFANGLAGFASSYSDPLNLNATSIRVDHAFNDKMILFGRYNHSPSATTQRGISNTSLNSLSETVFKTQTLTIGSTQSFSPTFTNEIRANYSKSEGANSSRLDGLGGAVPLDDSLVFPSFTTAQDRLLIFQITGARNLTVGKNVKNVQRQFNLLDNLSIVTGTHQLKFGVDYRLLLPVNSPRSYTQTVAFSGLTAGTGAISGIGSSATIVARDTVALSVTNFSGYGQDTWKATHRLTLTYGLRWDVNPAPKGRNGKELVLSKTQSIQPRSALRH